MAEGQKWRFDIYLVDDGSWKTVTVWGTSIAPSSVGRVYWTVTDGEEIVARFDRNVVGYSSEPA